jgi:hypothetical protein
VGANFAVAVALAAMLGVGSAADALEFCVKEKDAAEGGVRSGALVRVRELCSENERRVSPGEPAGTGAHAVWRDADGKLVGPYSSGELLHGEGEQVFRLDVSRSTGLLWRESFPPTMAFYASTDCSGTPLLRPESSPVYIKAFTLAGSGMVAYYPPPTANPAAIGSVWDDVFFVCMPIALTLPVGPPKVLDLSEFREPFSLALR